ncbi:MAG: hypothetical protein AAF843_17695, partial [Bacteroidota bacterium]
FDNMPFVYKINSFFYIRSSVFSFSVSFTGAFEYVGQVYCAHDDSTNTPNNKTKIDLLITKTLTFLQIN